MDCDYDPNATNADQRRGKKKRIRYDKTGKKNGLAEIKDVDEKYGKYMDELYKLDYEDMIGDLPCRFKYREVLPNNFGLSIEEILLAKDRELNRWCSLKKATQYRPENVEKYDVVAYQKKACNETLKKKILPSIYEEIEEPKEDENIKEMKEKLMKDGDKVNLAVPNEIDETVKKRNEEMIEIKSKTKKKKKQKKDDVIKEEDSIFDEINENIKGIDMNAIELGTENNSNELKERKKGSKRNKNVSSPNSSEISNVGMNSNIYNNITSEKFDRNPEQKKNKNRKIGEGTTKCSTENEILRSETIKCIKGKKNSITLNDNIVEDMVNSTDDISGIVLKQKKNKKRKKDNSFNESAEETSPTSEKDVCLSYVTKNKKIKKSRSNEIKGVENATERNAKEGALKKDVNQEAKKNPIATKLSRRQRKNLKKKIQKKKSKTQEKIDVDLSSSVKNSNKPKRKRKHSESVHGETVSKKLKKNKNNINKKNDRIDISNTRLEAYGINPKKYKNALKFKNKNK